MEHTEQSAWKTRLFMLITGFLFFPHQEVRVTVPVLSSSTYGHPKYPALDLSDRKHVRVEICKKDFLRLGGTNIGNTD